MTEEELLKIEYLRLRACVALQEMIHAPNRTVQELEFLHAMLGRISSPDFNNTERTSGNDLAVGS